MITVYWSMKVCAPTTVRVTACAVYLNTDNQPVGSPTCGKTASILMDPAKPEASSSFVDIGGMYSNCIFPTRIRVYLTTTMSALNKIAKVVDCPSIR